MKRKILIILAVIVVVAFALNGANLVRAWRYKGSAEDTFRGYSAALVSGDTPKAYEYCGDAFRRQTPYERFQSIQEQLSSAYGPLRTVEAESASVEGRGSPMESTAVLKATHKYQKREVVLVYELHLDGGSWRIYGFKQLD